MLVVGWLLSSCEHEASARPVSTQANTVWLDKQLKAPLSASPGLCRVQTTRYPAYDSAGCINFILLTVQRLEGSLVHNEAFSTLLTIPTPSSLRFAEHLWHEKRQTRQQMGKVSTSHENSSDSPANLPIVPSCGKAAVLCGSRTAVIVQSYCSFDIENFAVWVCACSAQAFR